MDPSNPYYPQDNHGGDFITSLLTDGAKFLRVADDVHTLMEIMQTMSSCLYLLTIGVYLGIMMYIVITCYRERRISNEVDQNLPLGEIELGTISSQPPLQSTQLADNHVNLQQQAPSCTTPVGGVGVRGNRKTMTYRRHLSSSSLYSTGDQLAKQKEASTRHNQQQNTPLLASNQPGNQAHFGPGPGTTSRRINRFQAVVAQAQANSMNSQNDVFDPQAQAGLDEFNTSAAAAVNEQFEVEREQQTKLTSV